LKGQKYSEIGDKNGFTEGHVRDVGYELLQLLSNIFDKPLNKRNLKKFLAKKNRLNVKDFNNFGTMNHCLNYYGEQNINLSDKSKSDFLNDEPKTKEYQQAKYQLQIKTAKKLKKKGLSDAEIAEILEIDIEELSDYLQ
jgi:hypothetical protein